MPVYPCINAPPLLESSEDRFPEAVRALATRWYSQGADGVYFWNLGSPFVPLYHDEKAWRDLSRKVYACLDAVGNLAAMAGKSKLYLTDPPPFAPYVFIASDPPLPLLLEAAKFQAVSVMIGDNVKALASAETPPDMELTLALNRPIEQDALVLRLNQVALSDGEPLTAGEGESRLRIRYAVQAPPLQKGGKRH